jgi:hypothetical protein
MNNKFLILSIILGVVSLALVVILIVCINIINEKKDIELETNIPQFLTNVQPDTVKVEYDLQSKNQPSPPIEDDREEVVSSKLLKRFQESYNKDWKSFSQEEGFVYSDLYDEDNNLIQEKLSLFEIEGKVIDLVPNSKNDALLYSVFVDNEFGGEKKWYVYDLIENENILLSGVGYISFGDPVAYGMTEEFKWVGNEVNLISAVGKFHYCEKSFGYIYDLVQKQVIEIRNNLVDCTMPETSFEQ